MQRSKQTLTIEAMLREGQPASSIARTMAVSRQRVQHIRRRMSAEFINCAGEQEINAHTKTITINLTPPVYDDIV